MKGKFEIVSEHILTRFGALSLIAPVCLCSKFLALEPEVQSQLVFEAFPSTPRRSSVFGGGM